MDAVFPKRCFYRKATVLVPYPIKLLDDIHEGFKCPPFEGSQGLEGAEEVTMRRKVQKLALGSKPEEAESIHSQRTKSKDCPFSTPKSWESLTLTETLAGVFNYSLVVTQTRCEVSTDSG